MKQELAVDGRWQRCEEWTNELTKMKRVHGRGMERGRLCLVRTKERTW